MFAKFGEINNCSYMEPDLLSYLASNSRNKLVFYKEINLEIKNIDLGLLLSQKIYNLNEQINLPFKVASELDLLMNQSMYNHKLYGRMVAISNVGILLEPELKLDINKFFDNYSLNTVLFVKWDGEIDSDFAYFVNKKNSIKIKINNLSHIVI